MFRCDNLLSRMVLPRILNVLIHRNNRLSTKGMKAGSDDFDENLVQAEKTIELSG